MSSPCYSGEESIFSESNHWPLAVLIISLARAPFMEKTGGCQKQVPFMKNVLPVAKPFHEGENKILLLSRKSSGGIDGLLLYGTALSTRGRNASNNKSSELGEVTNV